MTYSNLNFKASSATDKATLLKLMERYYESDHLVYSEPKADQALTQLLKNSSLGRIWLIEADSKTVGYVALTYGFGLEFGGRVAFVDELFVEESHRGKGIGTAAIRWCMQECRAKEIPSLRLEVTPTNSKALKLYTHLGFVDHSRSLLTYEVSAVQP
ncbi:MAG: GNAT family N-acetyltransferase [Bdellovibrionia bacterium]